MKIKLFKWLISLLIVFVFFAILMFTFLVVRFPSKYITEIETYSSKYNLDVVLIQSVIKVESGYDKDVISNQGAIGLMQILPSTASEIASKLNFKEFDKEMLKIPQINIEFGCFYLRYLIDYYSGNLTNALCAYNAGLNNVNQWLNEKDYSKNGIELNQIPFKETNEYIKRINFAKKVYKNLFI